MTGTRADLPPARSPANWPALLIALMAMLALVNLVTDSTSGQRFGWDARVNCAAVDAHLAGLDPYLVKNLKDTRFSYPYLPVTLDVFRPLCAGGALVRHHMAIYAVIAALCCLFLPGIGRYRPSPRDAILRILFALGAFLGFEWTFLSGNFTIFTGLLTVVALTLLLPRDSTEGWDDQSFPRCLAGAAVLGLLTSFKLVFCPVLAALYFLPLSRERKLAAIAVAAGMFILPILLSMVLYGDLFPTWLKVVSGQLPDQHSPVLEGRNPSVFFLARGFVDSIGLAGSGPSGFAAYGLAVSAFVLAPFALTVLPVIGDPRSSSGESPLKRLDQWLIGHPREATRVMMLAMYALYLCAPRLKEYAFFELAIYAAVLVVDLPAVPLAALLTLAIGIPTLSSLLGNALEDSFGQLVAALVCFWILLLDFRSRRAREPGANRLHGHPSADTSPAGSTEPPAGSASLHGRPSPVSASGVSL